MNVESESIVRKPSEVAASTVDRPPYETPRIQAMSERDILNSFQITQSMGGWWVFITC